MPRSWRLLLPTLALMTAFCARKKQEPKSSELPGSPSPRQASATAAALEELRAFDRTLRKKALSLPPAPSNQTLGANPYRIRALSDGKHLAGILRGRDELIVLDADLDTLARAPAPELPSALAVSGNGRIFVAGELSSQIRVYRWSGVLELEGLLELEDVRGIRGLELASDVLYVVEEHDGRLIGIDLRRARPADGETLKLGTGQPARRERVVGRGLIGVRKLGEQLVIHSLLEHALIGFELAGSGMPVRESFRIAHDGPIWAFDGFSERQETWALLAGVEDHPLERRDGVFGYVDSFLYLYRITQEGRVERLQAINASALGLVTPKTVELWRAADGHLRATASAYGSPRRLEIAFERGPAESPRVVPRDFLPGSADATRLDDRTRIFASPLLDSWLRLRSGDELLVVPEPDARREQSAQSKLGESLFFTTLMAPWNESEGKLSRFTCETCHFEGYVDGRVHYTGRADHRVSTKPLLGLYNNRPYFSRAMDPDLSAVSHHEFRVAGRGNDYDPWFSVRQSEFPWLARLGVAAAELSALELRMALVAFLTGFTHTPNPMAFGRSSFLTEEARGAELFRDRCARCHAPRLASDEPASVAPFERWEGLIFSTNAPLVWARSEHEKTGVLPYLHERGTRVPSLRRLYKKWPYFSNGSAKSLAEVLERARYNDGQFFHDVAAEQGALRNLTLEERTGLLAFLRLL